MHIPKMGGVHVNAFMLQIDQYNALKNTEPPFSSANLLGVIYTHKLRNETIKTQKSMNNNHIKKPPHTRNRQHKFQIH